MGCFRSQCINCGGNIDWFLDPPLNYYCVCKTYNSPQWIELSFALYGTNDRLTYHKNNLLYLPHLKNLFNSYIDSLSKSDE